jgi:4-methylaminobutanoate oxidase (formaldehyde-forming)
MAAGESNGLLPCGYRAIESLRLEKGYRAWGGEINTETNPYEAGLGFAVSLSKPKFIGRDALTTLKDQITRKLVAITFDDIRQVPLGNEPIRIDEKIVGRVKSGGQGYSIGKAIGYAYLPIEFATSGQQVDVEFFGTWCSGTVTNGSLYDPDGLKIKA